MSVLWSFTYISRIGNKFMGFLPSWIIPSAQRLAQKQHLPLELSQLWPVTSGRWPKVEIIINQNHQHWGGWTKKALYFYLYGEEESSRGEEEGGLGWRDSDKLYDRKLWSKSCQSSADSPLSGDGDLGGNWTLLSTTPQQLLQEDNTSSLWNHADLHSAVLHRSAHCSSQPAGHHLYLPL